MIKKLISFVDSLSIKYKLFISFFLLISVPFSIFIVVNSFVSSRDSESKELDSSRKIMLQAKSALEYKTRYLKNVMDIFALNDIVQDLTNKNSDYYRKNIGNWIVDSTKFSGLLYSIESNPDISGLHLYMKDGLAALKETDDFLNMTKIEQTHWYKDMLLKNSVYQWFSSNYFPQSGSGEYISFLRIIPSSQDINVSSGLLKADIPQNIINDILNQAVFTKHTAVLIINSSNEIISASGSNTVIDISRCSLTNPELNYNSVEDSIWKKTYVNNKKVLFGSEKIIETDWKLIILVPYNDILAMNIKTRNQIIIILLFIIPLTLPLSYWVANSSTKRIRKLISHMRKIEHGNFNVSILPGNNDEIGELIKNFNYTFTKIAILMDEKYKLGREVKNLELKALQAQINPHFLYNTLDLINMMSVKYKVPKIGFLVQSLSKFYKLSLSKGEDFVTIENELDHVRAYVQIQNMRFKDSIQLDICVPQALYGYQILKIVLQPLVENSILHGIFEKTVESGTIKISGELLDDSIILFVQDNGIGISDEKLPNILTGTSTKDSHGYGIKNVHDRLRINYGDEYGLTYKSQIGVGTSVEVKIPATKYEGF